jgi:hypothetical protein
VASTGVRRSRLSPAVVATLVAGVVAGCATLPSGSAPRQVLTGGNAVQAYPRPLPPPPPESRLYKTALDTVLGFLSASAAYAYDPGAARQFLSPALRATWQPVPVTVVSSVQSKTEPPPGAPGLTCRGQEATCAPSRGGKSAPAVEKTSVVIKAQHLATLSQSGQYEYSAGTSNYSFSLAKKKNGVWLITKLPLAGGSLLLTKASFQEVYQPRNLFFFARHGPVNGELVPDPVYAPLQSANNALNTDVAAGLVRGLLSDRGSWLTGATTTAFPPGTRLLKVTLRGQVAVVNLGGAAVRTNGQQRNDMYWQLQATLASKAYSSPLARNVLLEINGRSYPAQPTNLVGTVSRGPLVYQSGPDTVSEVNHSPALAGPEQVGTGPVTALAATAGGTGSGSAAAASGSGQSLPAVAVAAGSGAGCTVAVYVPASGPSGGPSRSRRIPDSGGPCTSLSWDRNGNLWAVAGGRIWLLGSQTRSRWLAVSSPAHLPSDGKSGPSILSMQMAPDGVRAALLVKARGGNNRVLLAAVVIDVKGRKVSASFGTAVPAWTGLPGPTALSWYSPYDLVVLTRTGVWQVPLTGGAGRLLGTAPAGAVSLASDGLKLSVGTSKHGRYGVYVSSNTGSSWKLSASDTFPPYPTYPTSQS